MLNRLLMHFRLICFNSFVSVSLGHGLMELLFYSTLKINKTEPCRMRQHVSVGFLLTYLEKDRIIDSHTINIA